MKKRGIIARLVMGKQREKDFTESDLPATRRAQFGFVLRSRFWVIIKLNLLTALFFLPFMVWDLLAGGYVAEYVSGLSVEEYLPNLLHLTLLQYGTEIPLLILGFTGLAGLYYVIRRICWGQSAKVLADFGKGIKQSALQFALLGLVSGIVNSVLNFLIKFSVLSMGQESAWVWYLIIFASGVFALIYAVVLMFALCQSSLYSTGFFRLFGNGIILTFKRLFTSLLICILSLAPILIFAFMPWAFVKIIGCCVAVVFSFVFAALLQTVYCHGVFDVFINKDAYPDFVNMGLAGGKVYEDAAGLTPSDGEGETQ